MSVGSPTAGTWSSSQWRPDNEFETDRRTPMATFRIRPGLRKSAPKPNSSRSLAVRRGARWLGRRKTISCCLSRRCSAITARTPPRPHSVAVMTAQSKQGEQEVLHARDSVGQTSGATHVASILDSARKLGIRDVQDPHRPMRYDIGRPRAVIRLRISQPRTTSLPCPAGSRARRPSPMMDLLRKNAFSTRP